MTNAKEVIWTDKKRTLWGLPWSFTRYTLTEDKLTIRTGLLFQRKEEIRLYRITDITLTQSLGQRIFNIGRIHCVSADKTARNFNLIVKNPDDVEEMLSDLVEKAREGKVSIRETV